MAWFCPTELDLVNPIMTPYPCCVQGPAPLNHLVFGTQQACHDNTSCCNNANQPGTGNLDVCCGGIDQGDPCIYTAWLSLTQTQRDGICQYCMASDPLNNPCLSEVSLYCRCCDGCNPTTSTTTQEIVRGVRRCPQFGPQLEFRADANPLFAIVWSYPIGTVLALEIIYITLQAIFTYRACWEIIELVNPYYSCDAANGTLLNPTPGIDCSKCVVPPGPEICTTTTTSEPPPAPYWCIKKCCDDSLHKIDATFPWDWSGTLGAYVPGTAFLSQSFNNLNGTGLQECYSLPDPPVFGCGNLPTLVLAPPIVVFLQTIPPQPSLCDDCLWMYEYGQIGDVYQWFPPTLPPPTGQAVDTGVDVNLCDPSGATTTTTLTPGTTTTTTTLTPGTTTTTTVCIWGCMDPLDCNYDPTATCDDGSCMSLVYGCMDNGNCIGTSCPGPGGTCQTPSTYYVSPYPGCQALNYYPGANFMDANNPCYGYCNCLDPSGTNYNDTGEIGWVPPANAALWINGLYIDCAGVVQMIGLVWNGNVGDTSCCGPIVTTTTTVCIWGCTDPTQVNFDPLATCNDGSCIPIIYGCMDDGCCTTGIGPDPLVGDPCAGGATGLYHLCPQGTIGGPSYNSPLPPPGALNYYPGANINSQCVYPPLAITFFEVGLPYPAPCANYPNSSPGQCGATYNININTGTSADIPQGEIKFTFEAHTTNPGVYYDAPTPSTYTHNTVTTSLDFDCQSYVYCTGAAYSGAFTYIGGLGALTNVEGSVPVKVIIELTMAANGGILLGEAVLQDGATSANISIGYTNNLSVVAGGFFTQTCNPSASSPGGVGGCV